MLNPHPQNININISYNLNSDKPTKLNAKRIVKMAKLAQPPKEPLAALPYPPARAQNNMRKSNVLGPPPQRKKGKKKADNPLRRNTHTPDLFAQRRIRTEGPSTEQDLTSTYKKEYRKSHSKSTHPHVGRSGKKGGPKGQKSNKESHNKSCELVAGWRKIPVELPEHPFSQSLNGTRKKRTQSTLLRNNDQVVSKLLNVSLLESELGGSQPMTSDRKSAESHSQTLKEYFTSIDMRIMTSLKSDLPAFRDKPSFQQKRSESQEAICSVMFRQGLSLQELTKVAIVIQRAWRRRSQKCVILISGYGKMFRMAAGKISKEMNMGDVSDIEPGSLADSSRDNAQFFECTPRSLSDSLESGGLNIGRYKELVKEQIERGEKKKEPKERGEWNQLNQKIGHAMNHQAGLDSKFLLDELIKQSNFNRKWIDEESSISEQRQARIMQKSESEASSDNNNELPRHTNQTYPEVEPENGESFDQSREYDSNKYLPIQPEVQVPPAPSADAEPQPAQPEESGPAEPVWVNPLPPEGVVRSYLESGLQGFGLKLPPTGDNNARQSEDEQDEGEGSEGMAGQSDEPIGARFERANIAALRKPKQPQNNTVPEPTNSKKVSNVEVDYVVSDLVSFLIGQFAEGSPEFDIDIAVILKKCTNHLERPRPPPRPPGIDTGYSSIQVYIQKFTLFLKTNSSLMQRIADNINRDLGPSSIEILGYLRPECQDAFEEPSYEEEQGLFVVPAEIFEEFEAHLEEQYVKINKKQMTPRLKAFQSFWHRCIFESYNQCLDYERPFGIQGKPYQWSQQRKLMRPVALSQLPQRFKKASTRLLDLSSFVGGIIFDKPDSPFAIADFNEQQMHLMNEQRLSRILAAELLESQQSWTNYNDQLAELLVELTRLLEDRIWMQTCADVRKLQRRRRLLIEESQEQIAAFDIDDLVQQ